MNFTFAMIKPDAVRAGNTGAILTLIEKSGFEIVCMEKRTLSRATVEEFYAIHKARPFFGEMVDFVVSGPVVVLALKKEGAVAAWRELMGATNPAAATYGTVRKLYGTSIGSNAAHGSDAAETAAVELGLFFPDLKLS
jgi:nucleoside-diphosphate kinase